MYRFDPMTGVASKRLFDATGAQFNGIACPSSTQCTAVNQVGVEYTFNPTPSPLPKPFRSVLTSNADPLQGIACLAANQCIAGDQNGNTQTFDPTAGKSTLKTKSIDASNELFGMSCANVTFCATIDGDGNAYEGAPPTGPFHHDTLPGFPSGVDSIACPSTAVCAAVDNSGDLYVGRGPAWLIHTSPNPAGAKGSFLSTPSCTSTTACTAVGHYINASGTYLTLAERWNGTSWLAQTTPNPGGTGGSALNGVSCTSTVCFAVGNYVKAGHEVTLAEHWTGGTSWSLQTTPNPTGATVSYLYGVSCTSTTACTAVGYSGSTNANRETLAERWNGTSWKIQTTPKPTGATVSFLSGVSCTSTTACTAVGHYLNSAPTPTYLTVAEHWNGTIWQVQTTPTPTGATGSSLNGVSCTSTGCTAVGNYANSVGTQMTFAERSNGTSWKLQTTPNPPGVSGSFLYGVSCTSATSCTAVGDAGAGTLTELWNGASWQIQTSPNPTGAKTSVLNGVSCNSATTCTAVGSSANSAGTSSTLAERYS